MYMHIDVKTTYISIYQPDNKPLSKEINTKLQTPNPKPQTAVGVWNRRSSEATFYSSGSETRPFASGRSLPGPRSDTCNPANHPLD